MSPKQSLRFGLLLLLSTVLDAISLSLLSDERNNCRLSPCENGRCINLANGFKCDCETGWVGIVCNIPDACDPNPCLRGICHNHLNANKNYICNCDAGYTGETCQHSKLKINGRKFTGKLKTNARHEAEENCNPNPCANGVCSNENDGYQCTCSAGWIGKNCDISNYCDPNPCVNGACINGPSGYNCSCYAGWSGDNCEIRNYCDPNPCVNGACKNEQGGCNCICSPGWSGKTCETREYCDPNPCAHGSCTNGLGRFHCSCEPNWGGETCADYNLQIGDF